jgi:hypothetical protein
MKLRIGSIPLSIHAKILTAMQVSGESFHKEESVSRTADHVHNQTRAIYQRMQRPSIWRANRLKLPGWPEKDRFFLSRK